MTRTLSTLLISVALLGACKKQAGPEASVGLQDGGGKAVTDNRADAMDEMRANFARVHFNFDSAELNGESKKALALNAKIMSMHPSVTVEIEGHCDERGTTEYNLALGQRRAQAVHDYLVKSGVSASRLSAVSFGEEAPLEVGNSESAFSQNRRAEFRVTATEVLVDGTITR